ncbi:MAG: ABC transporter ATP-binding protein [Solirubrobacteraceae bacterium]
MSALSAAPATTTSILLGDGLRKSFGGNRAVNGADLAISEGVITALIGPNGAGKSTVVNLFSGLLAPDGGQVRLTGQDVTGWPSHRIAQRGLIRTFQLSRELQGLTVLENLLVTPIGQRGESLVNIFFRPRAVRQEERANVERAVEILRDYGLYHVRDNWARELSGGQKRLLELARAVMARPKILLLDEPMAGVNPALVDQIGDHILKLKTDGITVLMIEHNLGVVERLCDHVIVMSEGRTLATGRMSDLRGNAEVVQAYLGGVLDARLDS